LPRTAAWKKLLEENDDFRRWFDNLARGSINTANENARILYRYLKIHSISLNQILSLGKEDRRQLENQLLDFITQQEKEGKAPTYLENYIKTINSWLRYNNQQPITKIKIGNRHRRPTIEEEKLIDFALQIDS